MATSTKTTKRTTTQVETNGDALAKAIDNSRDDKLERERAAHFAPINGAIWAEYSAQVRYAEVVITSLITAKGIQFPYEVTLAVNIHTGRYARCYGRNTEMKRIDNDKAVVVIPIHISAFKLPFDQFIIEVAHALSHVLLFVDTLDNDEPDYGMSQSATHSSKFADKFHVFGSTTVADRTNKQNLPVELNADTKNIIDRMTVNHADVIVTGDATPKPKRTPQQVLRLACPTDAAHFDTSNIEKRYRSKRPTVNLNCGKCDTRITAKGYADHSNG